MTRRPPRTTPPTKFARSYRAALAKHAASSGAPAAAAPLGARAGQLRIGTLALARIHDAAAATLRPVRAAARLDAFFAAVAAPIESAHAGATAAAAETARTAARLSRATAALAAARARVGAETERGRALRAELRTSGHRHQDDLRGAAAMEDRLRLLSHRLLNAQEEERMRISRDLHDAIGQTLTGINVGLATLKQGAAADSRELAEAISLTQQLVERSMKTVHQFAWELRPTLLDDLGLVPALRSYAKTFAERTGIRVRFQATANFDRLGGDVSTALFRVAQGALLNVERHARAGTARILLTADGTDIRLEVRDNGRSFDVSRMATSKSNRHLGLLVMRERVEMVGGRFVIESAPGRGTTVRAEIPAGAVTRD